MANRSQEIVYAVVGAGEAAVDKVKGLSRFADKKKNEKLYNDFVKRGRTVSTKVRNTKPAKQFRVQTDTVKEKATDAAKTVTKAFGVNVVSWPKGRKPATRKSTGTRKTTGTRKSTAKKTTAKAS
jgi:hypothetical protein